MMNKLKNCPFCGKKCGFYKNDIDAIVGVQCKNLKCGATVIFFPNHVNKAYNKKEMLIESFNRRLYGKGKNR